MSIEELNTLDDIEENELKYKKEFGYYPFNVSTWNPTTYFKNRYLLNKVVLSDSDYIPYLYSYEIEDTKLRQLKQKLRIPSNYSCLVTNTGTLSISLITSVLQVLGVKRMLVISPTYYAVLYNCIQKNINIIETHMEHINGKYILPRKHISELLNEIDAIWITNPIYNTGCYYPKDDLDFLKYQIPKHIFIICDDCFAFCGNENIYQFQNVENFIAINDPLKQIMVNGLKFSTISFDEKYKILFNQWSDIICGSLSYSTIQSIDYFNSPQFTALNNILREHYDELNQKFMNLANKFPKMAIDAEIKGHMRMCYFSHLPYDFLDNLDSMYELMKETGASIIPGNRFHFQKTDGFCFRVNMGRECEEFFDSLYRIFDYLSLKT